MTNVIKKVFIALSGLALVGFVAFHLLGIWHVCLGYEDLKAYAEFWENLAGGAVRLTGELALIFLFGAHMILTLLARWRAKLDGDISGYPGRYFCQVSALPHRRDIIFARSSMCTGLFIALFLVIHVAQMRFGQLLFFGSSPEFESQAQALLSQQGLFARLRVVFADPCWLAMYMLAGLCIGTHLARGLWSVWLVFGGFPRRLSSRMKMISTLIGLVLALVLIAVPLYVHFAYPLGVE